MNQHQKAIKFRALHEKPGAFIIPNPWDVGSARILASMKFEALATTSSGLSHSRGVNDGALSREQVLAHCCEIVAATDLPVSADLENGYGDQPEEVAKTITMAGETGLVGGSIEDHSMRPDDPIYEFSHALERIQAAVEAKHKLPHDFILTARCENFVWSHNNLDDTIKRLQAFEKAGADVLYAPGIIDLDTIGEICSALSKPVNVVMEMPSITTGLKQLAEVGVKRISVGSVLFLTAYGALIRAAAEMQQQGSFSFAYDAVEFSELEQIFKRFAESLDHQD